MLLCRIWSKIVLFVCLFKLEFLVFSSSIHRIHNILSCLKSIWLDKIIIAWQHARMYQRNHIFFSFFDFKFKISYFFSFSFTPKILFCHFFFDQCTDVILVSIWQKKTIRLNSFTFFFIHLDLNIVCVHHHHHQHYQIDTNTYCVCVCVCFVHYGNEYNAKMNDIVKHERFTSFFILFNFFCWKKNYLPLVVNMKVLVVFPDYSWCLFVQKHESCTNEYEKRSWW